MALNIYASNRTETLVETLAGVLREPLSSPFEKEMIVVQSRGMERWVAMELAKRFGVWANGAYPFPNHMVWRLFRDNLPDIPEESSFSKEVMAWRIMGTLPGLLETEEFSPLRSYLADDRGGLKLFQLAGRIADAFDQYTLFRPEMLLQWETGADRGWQGVLWRELAAAGNGLHRGRLKEEFCRLMETCTPGSAQLPERISLFGISYLPPFHMDILAATAKAIEVNLFLLSPTREYWADIAGPREKARMVEAERDLRIEGNPLLASLGRLGRDFSDMVIEIGEVAAIQEDLYSDPGDSSLLRSIQSDILKLLGAGADEAARTIDATDLSVRLHSCHSPMREIEVLHDNLLFLLEKTPGLEPRDILVMTPDIEAYAPFIAAVFAGAHESSRTIPYSIADRSLSGEGMIAATVGKLLALPGSRLSVTRVLDILESPPVRSRFDLAEGELGTVRGWLEETRVRWGMDEGDRVRLGLPGYRENSWQAALDRLLLGYALSGGEGQLFNGKLPFGDMEGADARTLGRFTEFIRNISELALSLEVPRSLDAWRLDLSAMLDGFVVADDESAHELAQVTAVVEELGEMEARAGFSGKVEFGVIRSWLMGRLGKEVKGQGFLTGGVTFCAMLPMRSIPFRVIALIGLNDGAFPRRDRPAGFDIISRSPRRGDRSLRDEDCYLFLEALLSARDCLYISYVGQSVRDNSEIPPSVLVSEFLDAIARGWAMEAKDVAGRLVTRHRLQAFSSGYFGKDGALFSYSAENLAALLERRENPWSAREFLSAPLPPPGDEWREVPLARLLRFYANPARFLLENRLGIRLEDAAPPLEEREPFTVAGLDAYTLHQEIVEIVLRGDDPVEYLPVARSRGILPPALHGEAVFRRAVDEATAFAQGVRERFAGKEQLAPLDFRLELGGFRLSGRLERIWPERMIRYRCANVKGRDQIGAWIEHLVLNAVMAHGYPRETVLMMVGGSRSYRPVADAATLLKALLDLYREGLTMPLRFFPESALEYAQKEEWRIDRAKRRWEEGFNRPGEGDDPYYRLCFGKEEPLNADFELIAQELLGPMIRHQVMG